MAIYVKIKSILDLIYYVIRLTKYSGIACFKTPHDVLEYHVYQNVSRVGARKYHVYDRLSTLLPRYFTII